MIPRGLPTAKACDGEVGQRSEWFVHSEERQRWRLEGGKEQPNMSSLCSPSEVMVMSWPVLPATEGHVWIHGSTAAGVFVNVHGTCYHQGPWECLGCTELAPPLDGAV